MERKESDEKKLWFDEHRTANYGTVMDSTGTNVIQGDYGCCCIMLCVQKNSIFITGQKKWWLNVMEIRFHVLSQLLLEMENCQRRMQMN